MVNEREICDRLYAFVKEGSRLRKSGGPCQHAANTIAHMLSSIGWVQEDLRQGLMKSDPDGYGAEQKRFDAAGVFD